MTSSRILVLSAALMTLALPAGAQFRIFVEPAEVVEGEPGALWVASDFSGSLKSPINKFVPSVQLVTDVASSNLILRHTAMSGAAGRVRPSACL